MSKTEKKLQKKIASLKAKLKVQKQREKAASKARDAADTAAEKAQRVYDRADGRYVKESDKTENLGREIADVEDELTREQEAPPSPISDD